MNAWQIAKELQRRLRLRRWRTPQLDPSVPLVWGGEVYTSAKAVRAALSADRSRSQMLLLTWAGQSRDPDDRSIVQLDIAIRAFTFREADHLGQLATLGNVTSEWESRRAGVAEAVEEVDAVIGQLGHDLGILSMLIATREQGVEDVLPSGDGASVVCTYRLHGTVQRTYDMVSRVTAAPQGGGAVLVAWRNPYTSRFDWSTPHVRRIAGSIPPTLSTGTEVAVGSTTASSVLDSGLTPGTYTWRVWPRYVDGPEPSYGDPDHATAVAA